MKPIASSSSSSLPRSQVKIQKYSFIKIIGALTLGLILGGFLFGSLCLSPSLSNSFHDDESNHPISSSLNQFLPWLNPILESLEPTCSIWKIQPGLKFLASQWNSAQWLTQSQLFFERLLSVQSSSPKMERTLALIKPDAYQKGGYKELILKRIQKDGFQIIKEIEIQLTLTQAESLYQEHKGKEFFKSLIDWMSSRPSYALLLESTNGIQKWRNLMGPTNPRMARESHPYSLRALYGENGSHNGFHGSDSLKSSQREILIFFP